MNDKTILITGGVGSLGSKLVEKLITEHDPFKVIVFSRGEEKQVELQRRLHDPDKVRYFIGDIRDKERLYRAFRGVDLVIHCAALKHIDKCLYNPSETTKTNIYGAENIVNAAIEQNVQKVIAISTDKATAPVNLYGAAKLYSDMLFIASNVYRSYQHNTKFSVIRFGNFWNSSGSVVQLFKRLKQEKAKTIPVTHPDMTRFFITLEDAASFVIEKAKGMQGGEIFTPEMKAMKIIDLAEQICPGAGIDVVGRRPGERLHETINVNGRMIRSDQNCVRSFST